jgi:hypothetical protein
VSLNVRKKSQTQINLIDDDYGIAFELSLFVTHIKREFYGVLESFPSFKKYMKLNHKVQGKAKISKSQKATKNLHNKDEKKEDNELMLESKNLTSMLVHGVS